MLAERRTGAALLSDLLDTATATRGAYIRCPGRIRPEKILRVCPVILSDEKGVAVAPLENMIAVLQLARNVYKRDANVRKRAVSRPFITSPASPLLKP